MCGIAGIYLRNNNSSNTSLEKDVSNMLDKISYRGPDDIGIKSVNNKICIGNCRLSIVDIKNGHQPMSNEDNNIWITYNGEIYNHIELKKLTNKHNYKTHTDTEVILHLFEDQELNFLPLLNGMFAFCLIDGKKLILVRDRLGIKPLYYRLEKEGLYFSSGMKSLLRNNEIINLNPFYQTYETTIGEDTLFKNIKQLPSASYLIFDGNEISIKKYWDLKDVIMKYSNHSKCYYIEKLRFLLKDAVQIRKPVNMVFGVTVSGGLDSTIIACLSKPNYLFSSILKKKGYDEEGYVDIVSKFLRTKTIKVFPNLSDFKRYLPDLIWYLEEPTTTLAAFPIFLLSKTIKKYAKVILNGQGADELFGGYIRHLMIYLESIKRDTLQFKGYDPLLNYFWGQNYNKTIPERYHKLIQRNPNNNDGIKMINNYFLTTQNKPISGAGLTDLNISFPPLLKTDDRLSMAFGVESRSPFLDHRIIEFAFSLPDELKIHHSRDNKFILKYILREAIKDIIPQAIINRIDKIGFPSPVALWLNNDVNSIMPNFLPYFRSIKEFLFLANGLDTKSFGEFNRSKWQIVQLTIWHMLFIKKYSINQIRQKLNLYDKS